MYHLVNYMRKLDVKLLSSEGKALAVNSDEMQTFTELSVDISASCIWR